MKRWLCPNCHSQTSLNCLNKHNSIYKKYKEIKNASQVAREFGISDKMVVKIVKKISRNINN